MNYVDRLKACDALLEGNFILTSGLYSHQYIQCAKLLQHPEQLTYFSQALADSFSESSIDVVISPAIGGIVLGTEVGRILNVRTIFAERDGNGSMILRRGFELHSGERVLVVEDVVTTGGSVKEVLSLVKSADAIAAGVGFIIDRSNGVVRFDAEKQTALVPMEIKTYTAESNPKGIESAIKPGSRKR